MTNSSGYDDKNILYGGPEPELIDSTSKSLGEVILKKLKENENDFMFIDGVSDTKLTRADVRARVIQLANSLATQYNVKTGDVIGICCENRLEFPIIAFAALCLGATLAPLNVTYTDREFEHTINLSQPKLIFVSKATIQVALKISSRHSFVQKVIVVDNIKPKNKLAITLSEFVAKNPLSSIDDFQCKPLDMSTAVAFVLCSSGTTGLPKGVELTQRNVLIGMSQFEVTTRHAITMLGRMCVLMVIPCFHAYGLLTSLSTSICGATIVLLPKFEEHLFLRTIQTYKTNLAFLVPPLLVFLAKSPIVDQYDLSSLMAIACGAATLSKELTEAVRTRLNIMAVVQGYGMSEMTLGVLAQSIGHEKSGSVGTLRAGVWGKIIDPDSGRTLGPNQPGELCFKGSIIMRGYRGNEAATKATIDPEGWLHTGDVGYYDEDHEWFIVDRLKELIKYKGFQVPPAEIEAILITHPDIFDAAVIGIPDERAGELPFAFVVRKPNTQLSEKDVTEFVAKTASPAKRLHGGVRFISAIPKNATGKILRRVLRDQVTRKKGHSKL